MGETCRPARSFKQLGASYWSVVIFIIFSWSFSRFFHNICSYAPYTPAMKMTFCTAKIWVELLFRLPIIQGRLMSFALFPLMIDLFARYHLPLALLASGAALTTWRYTPRSLDARLLATFIWFHMLNVSRHTMPLPLAVLLRLRLALRLWPPICRIITHSSFNTPLTPPPNK